MICTAHKISFLKKEALCEECSTYDVQVISIEIVVGNWTKYSI